MFFNIRMTEMLSAMLAVPLGKIFEFPLSQRAFLAAFPPSPRNAVLIAYIRIPSDVCLYLVSKDATPPFPKPSERAVSQHLHFHLNADRNDFVYRLALYGIKWFIHSPHWKYFLCIIDFVWLIVQVCPHSGHFAWRMVSVSVSMTNGFFTSNSFLQCQQRNCSLLGIGCFFAIIFLIKPFYNCFSLIPLYPYKPRIGGGRRTKILEISVHCAFES